MNYIQTKTVADYVIENIKTAHIFKKHEIDFCCGGAVSIKKACEKNNVNFNELVSELSRLENNNSYLNDYNK